MRTLVQLEHSPDGYRPFIAYLRVSTSDQGSRGMGLDAQKRAVEAFARQSGYRIVSWHKDIASGNDNGKASVRQGLLNAVSEAKLRGCPLLAYDSSRISRSAKTIEDIYREGVSIVTVLESSLDDPARRAAVSARSQFEREEISRRTKAGIAARKALGYLPGNPSNLPEARAKGVRINQERADALVRAIVDVMRERGVDGSSMTAGQWVGLLNSRGIYTRKGLPWTVAAIRRPLSRAKQLLASCDIQPDNDNDALEEIEAMSGHPLYGRF